MLTVYSTQGSPGASTTAMHLAAHWASEGREILLIEADPAGGSLSHNLGIQFTPGSASFVASGLAVQSNHLIDHAQDVLFENLHVMPAPASPTGARGIFNTFADFSEELRTISENEMAVIIDGGRVTADTAASGLTTSAAGVMVVCRNNNQLPSLEDLRDVLAANHGGDGPQGCSVAVGKSPMSPEEWQENCGLTFCGSIEIVPDMATDLSAYLARSKRKSKKWRASLEEVGEKLYPYAQPPVSNRPRRPAAAAAPPDTEVGGDAGQATPAAAATFDPAAQYPPGYGQAPPIAPPEGFPDYGQAPPMAPVPQPGYGQSHYLPPTGWPADTQSPSGPGYGEAPPVAPPEGFPAYGQPTPPPYPPAQYPSHPYEQPPGTYEQPPTYEQQPGTYEQPPAYEQQPQHPTQPGTYEQQPQHPTQPGTYEQQPQHPTQPGTYEQQPQHPTQPGTYEQQPQHPTQPGTYEQQPGPYEQQPSTRRSPEHTNSNPDPTNSSRSTRRSPEHTSSSRPGLTNSGPPTGPMSSRSTRRSPTSSRPPSPSPRPRRPPTHSRRRPSPRRGRT